MPVKRPICRETAVTAWKSRGTAAQVLSSCGPRSPTAMSKKNADPVKTDSAALTHNPFAALAQKPVAESLTAALPTHCAFVRAPPPKPSSTAKPPRPCRLSVRLETAGRCGKVVTRIRGLPSNNLETIATKLRKALGCGATVDGDDLLLLGSLAERAEQWLERAGDLHSIVLEQPAGAPTAPATPAARAPNASVTNTGDVAGVAVGTKRNLLRRGQRVAIVMKADQATGTLTEGIIRDLLTNSVEHPRGIKVRLESGQIGRVKLTFD